MLAFFYSYIETITLDLFNKAYLYYNLFFFRHDSQLQVSKLYIISVSITYYSLYLNSRYDLRRLIGYAITH